MQAVKKYKHTCRGWAKSDRIITGRRPWPEGKQWRGNTLMQRCLCSQCAYLVNTNQWNLLQWKTHDDDPLQYPGVPQVER